MGIADRRREQVAAAVGPQLEPGEEILANLPSCQTGPSPWFYAVTYLIAFSIRQLGVVVTDRRVFFVKRGTFTNSVKGVEAVDPRDAVEVTEWKPASLWSTLRIHRPGGMLKLNVHRMHREDAEGIVRTLAQERVAA